MNVKIKVAIIEDSEIHAEWLNQLLNLNNDFTVTSVDNMGCLGLDSIREYHPDIVLLDFQLPDITGLEVAKRIKLLSNNIKIVSLTSHTEPAIVERLISEKNIDAVAIKGSDFFEDYFIKALKDVYTGRSFVDPSLLHTIRCVGKVSAISNLTRREFEVFIQSSLGKSDNEISKDLFVDRCHIKNLKSKISKKIRGEKIDGVLGKLLDNINELSNA